MRVPENPPAFPGNAAWGPAPATGMTLRDWFAGQALNGLCASIQRDETGFANVDGNGFVRDCYKMADAMLAARTGAA